MTKKLIPVKLDDSGVTVQVPGMSKVSIILQLKRKSPPPKAPLVEVEIAGNVRWERNEADPDFAGSFSRWDAMMNLAATDSMLRRIALKQVLSKEQKEEVAEIRKALEGEELPDSDELLWLTECALGSDRDLKQLLDQAAKQADPSQEGVNQAKKNF